MPYRVGEIVEVNMAPQGADVPDMFVLMEVKEVRAGGQYTLVPYQPTHVASEARLRPRPNP